MTAGVLRRLGGAATDAGYLLLARLPSLRALYRRWAVRRYRDLAPRYMAAVHDDPAYFAALAALLPGLAAGAAPLIVEVGAGTGAATRLLVRRFQDAVVVAIDVSPPMLAGLQIGGARRLYRIAGDAFALPLRDRIGDLVLVHNAPFDWAELARVAAPAGAVAILLSSAGALPPRLLRWGVAPALRAVGWRRVRELRAGRGVAWVFCREEVSAR
ncbi:MAG TPA: methyltransferase domain-containing protein [bacterium]|nr:methyltransferase domain-containing protein [bacterium]